MKYTITVKELFNKPIIRTDFLEEWMNKMTDEELINFRKEIYEMCLKEGIQERTIEMISSCAAKEIDISLLYDIYKTINK